MTLLIFHVFLVWMNIANENKIVLCIIKKEKNTP
jgi:hypothetical protein